MACKRSRSGTSGGSRPYGRYREHTTEYHEPAVHREPRRAAQAAEGVRYRR